MKPTIEELEERDLRQAAEEIARAEHVTVREMFGASREVHVIVARGRFFERLQGFGWTQSAIARFVGRDTSTVRMALGKVKATHGMAVRPE